ncbi:MAG: sodium-dependent transporter [Candidatus Gastranaerophilales bacterium]|nr:sodium-dependent transporter [Candidatus Gastranaerophilales bacterium]
MKEERAQWSSHISFIIATIGSAVGLGNIWRFPYIMGENGGAIFLLTYLILIAFICVIPLCCELAIGKIFKTDTINAFYKINPKFKWFGWLCIITVILIPCFYFVVGGWILNYIWIFLAHHIPDNFTRYFSSYSAEIGMPCFLTLLFLVMCAIFPYRGVNSGIEKANNIMMPLFAVMLIFLAIFAITLPDSQKGLEFMFTPDFSKFNNGMILTALGQALFTLSIGMGVIITYGSYLKKDTNIIKSAYTLIFFDTLIAVLAGIMIFPVVFSYNVEPAAGATLIFISLPEIFAKLPCSVFFGVLFFILLFFAAVTSGISMMETPIAAFIENFNISRKKAAVILSVIIGIVSIPATLSFGLLSSFKIFDKTIFDLLDFTTSNLLLPFNTLIICLIAGWSIKHFSKEIFKNKIYNKIFDILLKFIIPIVLLLVLISGLK